MLTTFKSKAAADVVMYEKHAKRILDLLGKDVKRGVITADEADAAIASLEAEIARTKEQAAAEQANHEANRNADDEEPDNNEQPPPGTISFATRVYPVLEMLRAARKNGNTVAWGI